MADDHKQSRSTGLMLDPAALRAAQTAANAAGLSVEDWLSRTIVENARRLTGATAAPRPTHEAVPPEPPSDATPAAADRAPARDEPVQQRLDTALSDLPIDAGREERPPMPPPPKGLAPGESLTLKRRRRDGGGPSWFTAVLLLLLAVAAAAIWFLPRDLVLGGAVSGTDATGGEQKKQSWSVPLPPPEGQGVRQGDEGMSPEAARLRESAEGGDIAAQFELGRAYLFGEGVEKDLREAARWIFEAAKTGMPEAQYHYAVLLQNGVGVAQDVEEAIVWFQRAANGGHARAQYNTGIAYLEGQSVPQSYERAHSYLERAARQNLPEAQYNIGAMYEHGLGTEPDLAEALKWYSLAAEAGFEDAGRALDGLIPRLSEEERERGQRLINQQRDG